MDGYEAGFRARGWTTLSTFAFSSSWTPKTGDDTNFVEKVVKAILPSETHVDVPKLRKLYFEAYAMVAADLKAKLDSGPDADGQKLRRLAVVERKARWGEVPPYEFHRAVGARSPSDRQVPQHADGRGAPLYSTP